MKAVGENRGQWREGRRNIHVLGETIKVTLLLTELLLELEELFLLTLADGVILVGLFSSLEGVAGE